MLVLYLIEEVALNNTKQLFWYTVLRVSKTTSVIQRHMYQFMVDQIIIVNFYWIIWSVWQPYEKVFLHERSKNIDYVHSYCWVHIKKFIKIKKQSLWELPRCSQVWTCRSNPSSAVNAQTTHICCFQTRHLLFCKAYERNVIWFLKWTRTQWYASIKWSQAYS